MAEAVSVVEVVDVVAEAVVVLDVSYDDQCVLFWIILFSNCC